MVVWKGDQEMTESEIVPYRRKVYHVGKANYVLLDENATKDEYYVYPHRDGAYSILPCPPAPVLKDKPISCQQGTPGGEQP